MTEAETWKKLALELQQTNNEAKQVLNFIKDDYDMCKFAEGETDLLYVVINMNNEIQALKRNNKILTNRLKNYTSINSYD